MTPASQVRRRARRAGASSRAVQSVELVDAGELASTVRRLIDDSAVSTDDLLQVLDAVRRRARTMVDGRSRAAALEATEDSAEALQDAMVAREVSARRDAVVATERREPLRNRLLGQLRQPRTPRELADLLGTTPPQVSRLLRLLARDDLVTVADDPADGRRRIYSLTVAGDSALAEHRIFGIAPPRPAMPTDQESVAYLDEALSAAVGLRRRTNRLEDVEERIESIVEQATEAGADGLALTARAELAVTLRQAGRGEQRSAQVRALRAIASGLNGASSELALAAFAHVEYELGREPDPEGPADVLERIEHFVAAHKIFERLGREREDRALRLKGALAEAGLAELWREQTDLDRAILWGSRALASFVGLEDEYGIARSRLILGHCFRLRGQFEEAWSNLEFVHDLAAERGFERFKASALAQMGEVKRCVGVFGDASELLVEACACAARVRTVTYAFAQSALGATHWQMGHVEQAARHLQTAHESFSTHRYEYGVAFNLRRRAVVEARCEATRARPGQWLRTALSAYEEMRSPAGAIACVIELGLLSLGRRRRPFYLPRLRTLLQEGSTSRLLVEMDPWVPRMLVSFADEVGDGELHATALAVARGAAQRLEEQRLQVAGSIATSVASNVFALPRPSRDVDPMAGEPRRQFQLTPAAA